VEDATAALEDQANIQLGDRPIRVQQVSLLTTKRSTPFPCHLRFYSMFQHSLTMPFDS
jgi:hypothetical protein